MKYFDLSDDSVVDPLGSPVPNGGFVLPAPTPWPVGAGLPSGLTPFVPCPPPVVLGQGATDAAVLAVLGNGVKPLHGVLFGDDDDPTPYVWWSGSVPKADGRFWIPAAYRATDLPQIVADIAKNAAADDDDCGKVEAAARKVVRWHSGLGGDRVAWVSCARVEIDHLPRDDQERRLTALATVTGLHWGVQVFSGGKSVHAYLCFNRRLAAKDPIYLEIQDLLIATLEGDTTITNAAGLMRLPGYDGDDRKQPILHLDDGAKYEPGQVRNLLRAYAQTMGITDAAGLARVIDCLAVAKRLDDAAKHTDPESARDMRDHATHLRATRVTPDADDVALAHAMLGTHGAVDVSAGHVGGVGAGKVFRVPALALEPYKGMSCGTRTEAPCCAAAHAKGAAVVMSAPGESPRLKCWRCGHVVVALAVKVGADDLDAKVDAMLGRDDPRDPWETPPLSDERERQWDLRRVGQLAELRTDPEHYGDMAKKVEARRKEADAMDPEVVKAAREAFRHGKDLVPRYRKKYTDAGATWRQCGVAQGLVNVQTFNLTAYQHLCKSRRCPKCGPWVMAMQVAGICLMPPLDAAGHLAGRRLVDVPDLFAYEMDAKRFGAWKDAFDKLAADILYIDSIEYLPLANIFIRFQHGAVRKGSKGDRCVVLSNADMTASWPGVAIGDRPDDTSPASWVKYRGQVVQWVADALDAAIELEVEFNEVSVTGRVSASRGMTLRPETLVRRASYTAQAVMEPRLRSVEAARDAFAKTPFRVISETYDTEGVNRTLTEATTEPVYDGRIARAIWDQVAIRPPQGVAVVPIAFTQAVNAIVDEALGG